MPARAPLMLFRPRPPAGPLSLSQMQRLQRLTARLLERPDTTHLRYASPPPPPRKPRRNAALRR